MSAYLYADGADGAERTGWGQADVRFPQGDEPAPVEPGTPVELRLDLQPLDAVVPPGGRLLLAISQGTAYNRVPGQAGAPMTLEVGGGSGALELTAVAPDPDDFFEPR